MKRVVSAVAIAACLLGLTDGLARKAEAAEVTIMGGAVGGFWYILGAGFAKILQTEHPDLSVRVEPGGAVVNVARVSEGTADVGFALAPTTVMAMKGDGLYNKQYPGIETIGFGFSPNYMQILVPANFPFPDLESAIKAKYPLKITAPPVQSLGHHLTRGMLEYYGLTRDVLRQTGGSVTYASNSQQQDMMQNGQANVLATLQPAPNPVVMVLSSSMKLKLLPLPQGLVDMYVSKDSLRAEVMVHETYPELIPPGVKINNVAVDAGLIVSKKVPQDVVYKITRSFYEHTKDFSQMHAGVGAIDPVILASPEARGNGYIPLAAGAARYFEEKGLRYK